MGPFTELLTTWQKVSLRARDQERQREREREATVFYNLILEGTLHTILSAICETWYRSGDAYTKIEYQYHWKPS